MKTSNRSNYKGRGSTKPVKLMKYLEKTKVDELLDRARSNKRDFLLLNTIWKTGIRNEELTLLEKRDIKEDRIIIRQGKGKKQRWVPLDKSLGDLLSYHTADMTLTDKLFPLSTVSVRNITHKYQGEEIVTPHTLRHSYAVHCLKSGMNIRSLQKILGHKNLETTAIYLDLIGKDIMEDFRKVVF